MLKKVIGIGLSIILIFCFTACGGEEYIFSSSNETGSSSRPESVEGRQVKMTSGDIEVYITLNDSEAAADFVRLLPLELTLVDRNNFAKGMTLPEPLTTNEAKTREYEIGDLVYWPVGPDLAFFYDDIYEQAFVSVIPIGKAESGAEKMANATGKVSLELVPE